MSRRLTYFLAAVGMIASTGAAPALAQQAEIDLRPKDTRSDLDKQLDSLKPVHEQIQREKEAERNRRENPGPHDGRLKVGDETSVGGKVGGDSVEGNVRTEF
jgi:hypothetical protein